MNNNFYTYELAYPDGKVFYVGKGQGDRMNYHEQQARKGIKSYKCDAIRNTWDEGKQIIKRKVFETDHEQDACLYEWILINLIYGKEQLTNFWDGGKDEKTLYKKITLVLSCEIIEHIDKHTQDTRVGYIRRALSIGLTEDRIDDLSAYGVSRNKRCSNASFLLPLHLTDRIELLPPGTRSIIVEWILWEFGIV